MTADEKRGMMTMRTSSETRADIAREMRTYFQTQKRNGNPEHRPWHQVLSDWADRIEAAAVRDIRAERTEAIDEALAHAEEVREAKCRNCERASGNAAAMREALEELVYCKCLVTGSCGKPMDELCTHTGCIWHPYRAALSAPPRNCDVGTAKEQTERFEAFCQSNMQFYKGMFGHDDEGRLDGWDCRKDCPIGRLIDAGEAVSDHCQLAWAQMPYKAEGGAE